MRKCGIIHTYPNHRHLDSDTLDTTPYNPGFEHICTEASQLRVSEAESTSCCARIDKRCS